SILPTPPQPSQAGLGHGRCVAHRFSSCYGVRPGKRTTSGAFRSPRRPRAPAGDRPRASGFCGIPPPEPAPPSYPPSWISVCVTPRRRSRRMSDPPWDRVVASLEGQLPAQVLTTWIRPARLLSYRDNRLELAVPNKFTRQYIEQHYLDTLQAAATNLLGA